MPNLPSDPSVLVNEDKARFRRRVKRVSLLVVCIVVAAHLLVGVIASIVVVARYFGKPEAKFIVQQKQIEMKPEEREHKQAMDQVESMRAKPVLNNRIQSLKPSALMLPDLPKVPVDAPIPIAAVPTSATVGGNGQSGTGGGGNSEGFFGAAGKPGNGLLEGMFYDLKQTAHGQPTIMAEVSGKSNSAYVSTVSAFIKRGMQANGLFQYYHAPEPLYLSQVSIPQMRAELAPAAFNVKVQARNWVAVYRAVVSPPEDGTYRFAGEGDDVLIVRFNHHIVLDASLTRKGKTFPYTDWRPKAAADPGTWSALMMGDWIPMKKGEQYPIEILIGEQPGNGFDSNLYIQKQDVTYDTHTDGLPIIPNFRVRDVKMRGKKRPVPADGPIFIATSPKSTGGTDL